MKIKKSSVAASRGKNTPISTVKGAEETKYEKCIRYIRSAIDCLSDSCEIDAEDKEAIANLGVVALDVANKNKKNCKC